MWIGTAAPAGPAVGSGSGGCEEERTGEGQELVQSKHLESGGKKRNVRHRENDLTQSTNQWVCIWVVRLSEAERESENQENKDGKVV